jgi:peptidoglycan/xylan/chitin deacetylase (PgdA/CDA1 family)
MLKETTAEWTAKWNQSLGDREVCLTYDDGPSDARTLDIATFLSNEGIRATFFVVGQCIERAGGRELVAKLHGLGHLIGNHTFTHPYLTELIKQGDEPVARELVSTHALIKDVVGGVPLVFRPPFGAWDPSVCQSINWAEEMWDYVGPIMCDVHCFDWDLGKMRDGILWDVAACQEHLIGQFQKLNKAVVLLHDGSAGKDQTDFARRREEQVYELTKWLVGWLKGERYRFVALDDLLAKGQ